MNQTNHFFDLGYGWLCKHCSAEATEQKRQYPQEPQAPGLAFASWTDPTHETLTCPRCGIEELVKS